MSLVLAEQTFICEQLAHCYFILTGGTQNTACFHSVIWFSRKPHQMLAPVHWGSLEFKVLYVKLEKHKKEIKSHSGSLRMIEIKQLRLELCTFLTLII